MKEALLAAVLALAAMTCAAKAQQPAYQIQYRPVAVAGDYYAVPRTLPAMQWAFGPRVVFIPRPVPQVQR